MTHAAFPQLTGTQALTTTPILSAGMPTHLLATFVTPVGNQTVRLSMTSSVPNNAIYIDWTGTQSLEQYPITNTTYTVFAPTTTEGAKVSVWSYDADDHLTVFSLSGVTLADVDCSPMTQLTCFSLSGSGISDLKWPASPGLTELSLDGCNFTSLDFSRYPELYFVNLDDNQFTSIDLSGLTKLGSVGLANNRLTEVKLQDNRSLWGLALTNNQLEHIDLAGAPNLSQLFLNHNRLSSIDLSPLRQLRVLYLDNNRFDFSNLPIPRAEWTLYTYGNQPTLRAIQQNGVVDLSSQKERDGVATVYTWFYGTPTLDPDTGELTGELLIENDEFSLENGVTTFHTDLDKVCCVLTNTLFPDMYLQTNEISVNAYSDGIRTTDTNRLAITTEGRTLVISGAADGAVFAVYSAAGQLVGRATAKGGKAVLNVRTAGTYIVATKGAAAKVAI
ncbi:MAG: leucine-rich repeat domain-containing protein [Bacteroidaceae bacterium]|nr:leucine-rich repeat domain-containing protein [Bacteroidaceae bacterium]